jgi:hypothetical protein
MYRTTRDKEILRTKQIKVLRVLLSNNFDPNDDIEGLPEELYGRNVESFWGNETEGLKVDLWRLCGGWMEIPESCHQCQSPLQIRI